MRTRIFLIAAIASVGLAAQDRTPPREIPLPPIKTRRPRAARRNELPVRKEMPEVLVTNGGSKVTTRANGSGAAKR